MNKAISQKCSRNLEALDLPVMIEKLPSVLTSWLENSLWDHETHHCHNHNTLPKMKHYPGLARANTLSKWCCNDTSITKKKRQVFLIQLGFQVWQKFALCHRLKFMGNIYKCLKARLYQLQKEKGVLPTTEPDPPSCWASSSSRKSMSIKSSAFYRIRSNMVS